tara:strand:- start:974 stop:1363 length:390 start_codon:yes stop_codon:yes gene_type:complete
MNKGSWGKVRAFFDVMTEEGFTIKGFKIIEGINGLFVSLPSQKGKDDEYFDTVYVDQELRQELSQIALQAYGMDTSPKDDLSFPKTNTESAASISEAPLNEQVNQEAVSEPATAASSESATYSEDDIPF